jgi:hypothetical protein
MGAVWFGAEFAAILVGKALVAPKQQNCQGISIVKILLVDSGSVVR